MTDLVGHMAYRVEVRAEEREVIEEHRYGGKQTALALRYWMGKNSPGAIDTGFGPRLYVEVTNAEILEGDSVYLLLYSGSTSKCTVNLDVEDMIPGRQHEFGCTSMMHNEVPLAEAHLVALLVGPPNIPAWKLWQYRDQRAVCAYGGEIIGSQVVRVPDVVSGGLSVAEATGAGGSLVATGVAG